MNDSMNMSSRVRLGMDDGQRTLTDLLNGPMIRFNEKPDGVLGTTGIYLVYEGNEPVYAGSTNNLRRRIFTQLFSGRNHYFATQMIEQRFHDLEKFQHYLISQCSVQSLTIDTEDHAHWLERYVIAVIRPVYNGGKRAYSKA